MEGISIGADFPDAMGSCTQRNGPVGAPHPEELAPTKM